jgi:hypothetical protein
MSAELRGDRGITVQNLIEKGISKFKVVRFGYQPRKHSPE